MKEVSLWITNPLVSWNVFGFDIVFDMASVMMVVITAILVFIIAIICTRNLKTTNWKAKLH